MGLLPEASSSIIIGGGGMDCEYGTVAGLPGNVLCGEAECVGEYEGGEEWLCGDTTEVVGGME